MSAERSGRTAMAGRMTGRNIVASPCELGRRFEDLQNSCLRSRVPNEDGLGRDCNSRPYGHMT